ncbi:glycoside hydrolase family 20 protein [Streptomyces sp. NPDC005438]|uniref:beta-N-acetylhexosaminidase n=1 Tax=Streptomyces sp. NPDC005438 TaxID=3156880 RepID=UPI00339F7CF9
MGRFWTRKTVLLAVGVVAALTIVLVVTLDLGGGTDDGPAGSGGSPTSSTPSHTPRPAGPDEAGPAPSTIPAVQKWRPEIGKGWKPDRDRSRVVADSQGPAVDEARLLARELGLKASSGPARDGDVELVVDPEASGMRESYQLASRAGRVTITAPDDAGVFYGTRTLLQSVRAQGRVSEGLVRDRPDRPQRGFMLDIARKHFSADWIADRIREMGDLKLNQLQLHLSDDQAFRVQSTRHPEVVSDPHLTKKQVRDLIRLASSRHITVVPEIDSPGHLGAVLKAHPDLQLRDTAGRATPGAIDIANPKAARLVDSLLDEYADLFPGPYWHLGGDEYQALTRSNPGASYPGLAQAARQRHGAGATVQDLATAWLNDRAKTVRAHDKTPQVWNDGMHRGGVVKPQRDRQVTYWTGTEYGARQPEEYLREGWKVVNLNDKYLYYVLGEPNQFTYPTGEAIYREWTPAVLRGSKAVPKSLSGPDRVLGGRFAVWCDLKDAQTPEQVARGIRLPLMATAQKLWDPGTPKRDWADFRALADKVE